MKNILQSIKKTLGLRSPVRIGYHWTKGSLAYALSRNPAKGMYIIGITGTKGKTTTSTLIARALEESGKKVALISTAQIWIASHKTENHSKMTMDNPRTLWKILKKAKQVGVTHVVLETSSHGIIYYRNFGIHYNAVLLTNISQDHLDLHGTMEHYAQTKARIFKKEVGKICILSRDCTYFDIFEKQAGKDAITYSMQHPATYQTRVFKTDTNGTEMLIKSLSPITEEALITSKLVGKFNAENMLAAFALLRSIGIEVPAIQKAWKDFIGAPGRMESVPNNREITILVDYAHTEASLRSVLETLKNNQQRILLVFGATGDRDTSKRPKMGKVAHDLADIIILTDDDTFTEPSERIIGMVQEGIPREIGETFQVIPDRKEAIYWALNNAQSGDIVLIAGKGCETAQITNAGPIPWSDRGIVEAWLKVKC